MSVAPIFNLSSDLALTKEVRIVSIGVGRIRLRRIEPAEPPQEAEHEKDCERRENEDENGDTSDNVVEIEEAQARFASLKVHLGFFSERVRLNNHIVQVWSKLLTCEKLTRAET
jgi:hypothetical protein